MPETSRGQRKPRASRKPVCHPDRKHVAKGLCQACYLKRGRNRVMEMVWGERKAITFPGMQLKRTTKSPRLADMRVSSIELSRKLVADMLLRGEKR